MGTRVEQVVLSIAGQSGADLTTTADSVIMRTTTFNGNSAQEAQSTVQARSQSNPEINSDSITKSYTRFDGSTVKTFGVVTDAAAAGLSITTTVSNDPAYEQRHDLDPGQGYSQTYTVTTNVSAVPFPIPPVTVNSTITYVGQESVTVPAGSFQACKFTEQSSNADGSTNNTTTWFAVGSGQFLKSISDGDVSELISAAINGTPVVGN